LIPEKLGSLDQPKSVCGILDTKVFSKEKPQGAGTDSLGQEGVVGWVGSGYKAERGLLSIPWMSITENLTILKEAVTF